MCVCERERARERACLSDGMIKCVSQQVGVREKAQNSERMSERDKESPSVRCIQKGLINIIQLCKNKKTPGPEYALTMKM